MNNNAEYVMHNNAEYVMHNNAEYVMSELIKNRGTFELSFTKIKFKDKNGEDVFVKDKNGNQLYIDLYTSLIIIHSDNNSLIAVGEWNKRRKILKYFPEPFHI